MGTSSSSVSNSKDRSSSNPPPPRNNNNLNAQVNAANLTFSPISPPVPAPSPAVVVRPPQPATIPLGHGHGHAPHAKKQPAAASPPSSSPPAPVPAKPRTRSAPLAATAAPSYAAPAVYAPVPFVPAAIPVPVTPDEKVCVKLKDSEYHTYRHARDPPVDIIHDYTDAKQMYTKHFSHLLEGKTPSRRMSPSHFAAWLRFHDDCRGRIPINVVVTTGAITRYHLQVGDVLINLGDDHLVRLQCINSDNHYRYLQATTGVYDLQSDCNKMKPSPLTWLQRLCNQITIWNAEYRYDDQCDKLIHVQNTHRASSHGFVRWMVREMKLAKDDSWMLPPVLRRGTPPIDTHYRFDQWVVKQDQHKALSSEEYHSLKVVDRGMWYRYLSYCREYEAESKGGATGVVDVAKVTSLHALMLQYHPCCVTGGTIGKGSQARCPFDAYHPNDRSTIAEIIPFRDMTFTGPPRT